MPTKRVLISLDERTLDRIDAAARRHGLTRSGFLVQAALAQIESWGAGGEWRSEDALPAADETVTE
jgi:hypothetical protein